MSMFDFLKPKPLTPQAVEPGTLLVIEDVFDLQNTGPVVVGMANAIITNGQTAVLRSGDSEIASVTVAGIEKLGQRTESCQAGDAVGLILQGVEIGQITQGDRITAT